MKWKNARAKSVAGGQNSLSIEVGSQTLSVTRRFFLVDSVKCCIGVAAAHSSNCAEMAIVQELHESRQLREFERRGASAQSKLGLLSWSLGAPESPKIEARSRSPGDGRSVVRVC